MRLSRDVSSRTQSQTTRFTGEPTARGLIVDGMTATVAARTGTEATHTNARIAETSAATVIRRVQNLGRLDMCCPFLGRQEWVIGNAPDR